MARKQKGQTPEAIGQGERIPARLKLGPDTLANGPQALLDILRKAIPGIRLEAEHLERLALMEPRDIQSAILEYTEAVQYAKNNGMILTAEKLIENAAGIFSYEPWKILQLNGCVRAFSADCACELFLSKYLPNMERRIFWRPLVETLNEYDEESIVSALLFGEDFEEYLKEWDRCTVMAEEAMHNFGFNMLPQLELGGSTSVVIGSDQSFSTTMDGRITIPPYISRHEERQDNLCEYHVSFWHEIGHHKWKSFTLSMHPDIFDYDSFGVAFVESGKTGDGVSIALEKDGKRLEVRTFMDVLDLVKHPKLLRFLHNVADDGRIDDNNMDYLKGLRDEYRRDMEYLFSQRPELKGEGLDTLLEMILQYSIERKVRGEVPQGIAGAFSDVKRIIDSMQRGMDTDGTDSMNAAIRIYRLIEQDFNELQEKMESIKMPGPGRNSKTTLGQDSQPALNVDAPGPGRKKPRLNPADMVGKPEGGQSVKPQEGSSDRENEGGRVENAGTGMEKDGSDGQKQAFYYDGWDGEKAVWEEHCVVELRADGPEIIGDAGEIRAIKAIFQKYAPKQGVLERGLDDGEVDPELFQEFVQDLHSGKVRDKDYYSRVVYEERDVATGVLIDLSGSTSGIREEIIRACTILGTASDVLKDPLVVAGFTTGESSEDFIVMKDILDRGIRSSDAGGGTPMGGPLRHMSTRLMGPGIKHKGFKQVFLISDGAANVGKAPLEDAKKAVDDAWARGRIRVFGIGITSGHCPEHEMAGYFDAIFGVGNYLLVSQQDVADGRLHAFFEAYYRRLANKLR